MEWEKYMEEISLEVREAEKVGMGPEIEDATITASCGAILTIACC